MSDFKTVEGVEFNVEAVKKMTLQQFKECHKNNMVGKDLEKIYIALVPSSKTAKDAKPRTTKKVSRKTGESDKVDQ